MKIAIITPGGVDRGGIERVIPCLLWFIERLVRSGDEVHIFALRQQAEHGEWPLFGATVHNAGGANAVTRGARMLLDLRRNHRRARFDVIHALWAVPQGALAAIAKRLLGVPMLLHLPGGDVASLPDIRYGACVTPTSRLALRLAVSAADRIIAPSDTMVRQAHALGIPAVRVPFGVALDHWPVLSPRRRVNGACLRLLHVANLSPVKDQETLLIAAHELRARGGDFRLDIIGEDILRGAVQRRAGELGLGNVVRFLGFMPQAALRKHMCQADVLVVSSMHEAGPIVALEAAASGVPTVGTKVGILADWAPQAARVVPIGDGAALAAAILDVGLNDELRLRLASDAQKRAIAENADVTTRQIQSIYAAMMGKKAPAEHARKRGPRKMEA